MRCTSCDWRACRSTSLASGSDDNTRQQSLFWIQRGEAIATIFHITRREAWKSTEAGGTYRTETFSTEGFIHCSTRDQVIQVANSRFRGQTGLVVLSIDTERVTAEITYENLEGGQQMFPHIYGELNVDAVVQVAEFEPGANGYFELPGGDRNSLVPTPGVSGQQSRL